MWDSQRLIDNLILSIKFFIKFNLIIGILKKSTKKFCGHVEEIKKTMIDEENENENLKNILEFFPVD